MINKQLSPEEALKIYHNSTRGSLKVFLGYAAGVGKTYEMLNEANRRVSRYHQNVVIGYLEPHDRPETLSQIRQLKSISPKEILYNGKLFKELDIEKIIALKPELVLVDELAHTNAPGSKNEKRYMDVEELLNNGINVLTTVNIQHLESLNDIIRNITGIVVKETIPDRIIKNADEIVMIDITPDALQNRLKRGDIYKSEVVPSALKNFFRKGNLNALRELALRQTADEVDEDLEEYMKEHDINTNWFANEKVLVCISSSPSSKKLIRRGARIARKYKCNWYVVSIDCTNLFAPKLSKEDLKSLESHEKLAHQLGGEIIRLKGKSVSSEIIKFAHANHVTQLVLGHSNRTSLQVLLRGSTLNKILKESKNIEIHIIPHKYEN